MMTDIPGRSKTGRPKTRWKDICKRPMDTVALSAVKAINSKKINSHNSDIT